MKYYKNGWYNQTGNFFADTGTNYNTWNEVGDNPSMTSSAPDYEYGGEPLLGDTIDKFDTSGRISYPHEFDKFGLPEALQMAEQNEHCEFIRTQLDKAYSDMNFATNQYEIDRLYEVVDKLNELAGEENCI